MLVHPTKIFKRCTKIEKYHKLANFDFFSYFCSICGHCSGHIFQEKFQVSEPIHMQRTRFVAYELVRKLEIFLERFAPKNCTIKFQFYTRTTNGVPHILTTIKLGPNFMVVKICGTPFVVRV